MNTDLELSTRLDGFGRSLASGTPLEPPRQFLDGVQRQHRLAVVKTTALYAGAAVALTGLIMLAVSQQTRAPAPGQIVEPRTFELPAIGALQKLVSEPDDLDDAQLLPRGSEAAGGSAGATPAAPR